MSDRWRAGPWRRFLLWVKFNVPFGLRSVVGLFLVAGGILGALPVLGFWMIPLGIAVMALDWVPVRRFLRRKWRKLKRRRG